jgi:UDP-4-amino-4,6-dideoxy-N-acetyl-beta-L-altrosamine transaminase
VIPYGRHFIEDDDIEAVVAVLKGEFLTGGPAVGAFEAQLADRVKAPHAVACANGTAALHLAMLALGIGPGDAVVVPTLTFLATANAVRLAGADVRFADVDPDTGLMTPETLVAAIEASGPGELKAISVVHLNGQCPDMDGISAVARRHGLALIEDACHAIGGSMTFGGEAYPIGSAICSDAVCFSFHPVKTIAMGEGGAVTTRNPRIAERVMRLRNHGMVRDPAKFLRGEKAYSSSGVVNPWYYEMQEVGLNYRASDMQCALGSSQLRKLDRFLRERRGLAAAYDTALARLAPNVCSVPRAAPDQDGWHLYAVLIPFQKLGRSRADVMASLRDQGVGTQVHYIPVHWQPFYNARYSGLDLPGAEAYYARCLSLPLFVGMDSGAIDRVVTALGNAIHDI